MLNAALWSDPTDVVITYQNLKRSYQSLANNGGLKFGKKKRQIEHARETIKKILKALAEAMKTQGLGDYVSRPSLDF